MPVLRNIGQLATCRAEGGQGDIHAIPDAALAWEGDTIRWVGPAAGAAAPSIAGADGSTPVAAGDPGPGRLPHPPRLRRLARRRVRAADPRPELPRHRGGRRRHRARRCGRPAAAAEDALRRARAPGFSARWSRSASPRSSARAATASTARPSSRCSGSTARLAGAAAGPRSCPTFLGAHVVPPEFRDDRAGYVALLIDELIPGVARERLARVLRRVRRGVGVHGRRGPAASCGRPRRPGSAPSCTPIS